MDTSGIPSYTCTDIDISQALAHESKAPPGSGIESTDRQAQSSSLTPSYSPDGENSFVEKFSSFTLAPSYKTDTENVSQALPSYSSAPFSIEYTSETSEAPTTFYTPTPSNSVDAENRAQAPVQHSSAPASASTENGPSVVITAPFYSSAPAANSSAAVEDRRAPSYSAAPASTATENKEVLFYSISPSSSGTENGEAPFYSSGKIIYSDNSGSKVPSYIDVNTTQSDSGFNAEAVFFASVPSSVDTEYREEALFYSSVPSNVEANSEDVKVPFYTPAPFDTDVENREPPFHTLTASSIGTKNIQAASYNDLSPSTYTNSAGNVVLPNNLTISCADTESSGASSHTMTHASNYYNDVEGDTIEELPAGTLERLMDGITYHDTYKSDIILENDPRFYRDSMPKDIVRDSDDWWKYTVYDCSTQTYHFPNGETQFIGIGDLTPSNTENAEVSSYTATSYPDAHNP